MNATLIDSHTHLDAVEFDSDRDDVIRRARDAGVTRIITIGAGRGFDSASSAIALAEKHDFIYATAGVHPHDAGIDLDIGRLESLVAHPKVVAVGETGLDFYRDWSPVAGQRKWFAAQIEIALKARKPLVIHSRQAGEECIRTIEEMGASAIGGVFHCYAEDEIFAERLAGLGFLVSVPGTLTFKKADELRRIFAAIPLEQIMVETDAPYMAPEPYRGKRCESSFVVETARVLANVKNLSLDEVAAKTTENAERLFGIPKEKRS